MTELGRNILTNIYNISSRAHTIHTHTHKHETYVGQKIFLGYVDLKQCIMEQNTSLFLHHRSKLVSNYIKTSGPNCPCLLFHLIFNIFLWSIRNLFQLNRNIVRWAQLFHFVQMHRHVAQICQYILSQIHITIAITKQTFSFHVSDIIHIANADDFKITKKKKKK